MPCLRQSSNLRFSCPRSGTAANFGHQVHNYFTTISAEIKWGVKVCFMLKNGDLELAPAL